MPVINKLTKKSLKTTGQLIRSHRKWGGQNFDRKKWRKKKKMREKKEKRENPKSIKKKKKGRGTGGSDKGDNWNK